MKSDEKLSKIIMDIYRQAYKEAEPSADLDKLIKTGVTKTPDWYMKYHLPGERYKSIINLHCKKNKITKRERMRMDFELYLGAAPCGVKKKELKVI